MCVLGFPPLLRDASAPPKSRVASSTPNSLQLAVITIAD